MKFDISLLEKKDLTQTGSLRKVILLGVGGVGSNVIRSATCGNGAFKVDMYDHDKVELHNLNRTILFNYESAIKGYMKVNAAKTALRDLGMVSSASKVLVGMGSTSRVSNDTILPSTTSLIIDARDTMDPQTMLTKTWIKLAYDGGSNISFTFHPKEVADKMLVLDDGRTNSYEVTPSFYVPAAILGAMVWRLAQFNDIRKIPVSCAGTVNFNIDDLLDQIAF